MRSFFKEIKEIVIKVGHPAVTANGPRKLRYANFLNPKHSFNFLIFLRNVSTRILSKDSFTLLSFLEVNLQYWAIAS